jgi:nitroreductase
MRTEAEHFDSIVRHRRSVRIFDKDVRIPEEVIMRSVERATLAPNSSNLQLWEFHWIGSEDLKKQFGPLCLGQNAGTTADSLMVVVVRRDLWKKRQRAILKSFESINMPPDRKKLITQYYGKLIPMLYSTDPLRIWSLLKKVMVTVVGWFRPIAHEVGHTDMRIVAHKSAALAAQNFMLSIAAEGYDTCPMEGMDSQRIKKVLKLPRAAEISMVIGIGMRKPEGVYGARWRVPMEEVFYKH